MMTAPWSTIFKRWFAEHKSFKDGPWSDFSVQKIWSLWLLYPNEIRVVKNRMIRPNYMEFGLIFKRVVIEFSLLVH